MRELLASFLSRHGEVREAMELLAGNGRYGHMGKHEFLHWLAWALAHGFHF